MKRNRRQSRRRSGWAHPLALLPMMGAWICMGTDFAKAADTVETWDVGATDVEFYAGFDGIGLKGVERNIYSDMLLGYGLTDRLSAYLGLKLQGNAFFGDSQAGPYLGIFGTLVDTDHFDLDLFYDVAVGGAALSEFEVAPAVELNFDRDPQRRSWGAYLRFGVPIYKRSRDSDTTVTAEHKTAFSLVLNPGLYLAVADKHQILLEYDMSFHRWSADEHPTDMGGLALGYNVKLNGNIELINQVYLDVPQRNEVFAVSVMTGFIATLPSPRQWLYQAK